MVRDTIERLRAAIKMKGITKRGLAAQAGLHENTLKGCESDSWDPKASTLIKLEPFLPELPLQ